jgi:hypothetical protein
MQTPGWSGVAVTLALLTLSQSPSAMAAVVVYTVNAERKWPTDEREPFVTSEALRLMEAAVRALAADRKVDNAKLKTSIDTLVAARAELEPVKPGDDERPALVRDALIKGATMVEALTTSLRRDDETMRSRLTELKRSAEALDRKRKLEQQADSLERYFHQASVLLNAMLDAPTTK